MIAPFRYEPLSSKVLFGAGRLAEIGGAIAGLGCRRALVLTTPPQAEVGAALAARIGESAAGVFSEAAMHTPVEVTAAAMRAVEELGADCLVAIGGGSTIGLAKAIALRTDLPQIAIPTTYAGSEMTDIIGETSEGAKRTQRTRKVVPEVVIYDVELTLTLPPHLSAVSGMNALAHALEALYAPDGNFIVRQMAEEGIRALAASLPIIVERPRDLDARSEAQYGAWLCGACLGQVSMALHHKLCHVLGGSFDLPHAETHAVVLPHAAAYNARSAPEAMAAAGRALGSAAVPRALWDLGVRLGVPRALRDLGMPEEGIDRAAVAAIANPYWNPRPVELDPLRRLLREAYEGTAPAG